MSHILSIAPTAYTSKFCFVLKMLLVDGELILILNKCHLNTENSSNEMDFVQLFRVSTVIMEKRENFSRKKINNGSHQNVFGNYAHTQEQSICRQKFEIEFYNIYGEPADSRKEYGE